MNPGATLRKWKRLRINRPAPASRISAIAISDTTRRLRSLCRDRLAVRLLPLSRSVPVRLAREACHAGARPKRTPVSSETANVNPRTTPSSFTSEMRGRSSGLSSFRRSSDHSARARPAAPPRIERRTLSVSSSRMIRPRPAPRADLTTTSCSRSDARRPHEPD